MHAAAVLLASQVGEESVVSTHAVAGLSPTHVKKVNEDLAMAAVPSTDVRDLIPVGHYGGSERNAHNRREEGEEAFSHPASLHKTIQVSYIPGLSHLPQRKDRLKVAFRCLQLHG